MAILLQFTSRLYKPTLAAVFSRKSDPSRTYFRSVVSNRCPGCGMIARSGTPAAAVARPERSECPARSLTWKSGARLTTRPTDCAASRFPPICAWRFTLRNRGPSSAPRISSQVWRAYRAGGWSRTIGDADASSLPFGVGLGAADFYDQAFGVDLHIVNLEAHQFGAAESAGKT
jgi:hypothetical protein